MALAIGVKYFTDRPADKAVGVLGGMGPAATAEFLAALARHTPADKDWNHLHTIVESNPRMPSRARAYLFGEESPAPYLERGAVRLQEMGAQIIAVPSNSAAHFLDAARRAVSVPMLDPIGETLRVLRQMRVTKPLLLAKEVAHELYASALTQNDISPIALTGREHAVIIECIEKLKLGDLGRDVVAPLRSIVSTYSSRGSDVTVLACTELSLVAARLRSIGPQVLDSSEQLAISTVAAARSD